MTLLVAQAHRRGELAYWIGRPYWRQGYATEAAARVLAFAFNVLDLNRVTGQAMRRNPASTRVPGKLEMTREGTLCQEIYHWGAFEDIAVFGLLKADYLARQWDSGQNR